MKKGETLSEADKRLSAEYDKRTLSPPIRDFIANTTDSEDEDYLLKNVQLIEEDS